MPSPNPIRITEILRRAEQGITRPFHCEAEDGNRYWVKSVRSCGATGLIKEWIAAQMGRAFQLPIPEFCQVEVPELLIRYSANEEASELGPGVAFASRHVENANDLMVKNVGHVDDDLRRRVLVFDAWIRNGDRTLGRRGGNVNLLWQPAERTLRVFDHNNAFDRDFQWSKFATHHVFRQDLEIKDEDFAIAIVQEMKDIHASFADFTVSLPDEWLERVEDLADFSVEAMESVVSDYGKAADLMRETS